METHALRWGRGPVRFALGDRQHDTEHLRQLAPAGDPADDHLGVVAWFALTLMHIEHRLDESARTLIRNTAERRRSRNTERPDDADRP